MTLVSDVKETAVEYFGEDRKEASLCAYFDGFASQRRERIKAISLDMWSAYLNAYRNKVQGTDGKMVFDRFHIMRHVLAAAVVRVKKLEHKVLMKGDDDTLSRSKYLWLTNPQNMTDKTRASRNRSAPRLKTSQAWALKQALPALWHYRTGHGPRYSGSAGAYRQRTVLSRR
jgi:transposase